MATLSSQIKGILLQIKPLVAVYLLLSGKKPSKPPKKFDYLLGMTTTHERKLFYQYGQKLYTGNGEIVDLGCWLGSTTVPLMEGLLENPHFDSQKGKVYSYDLFVWQHWMNVEGTYLEGKYNDGESFLDEYKAIVKPYAHLLEIKAGDLCQIGWNGQPIEFLLVDAMKNWALANTILRDFYCCLIPGKSYVLHQDFAHYFTSWIHLLNYRFRDHFELVQQTETGGSALFKYTRLIPKEQLDHAYSFEDFSEEEINAAFDYSLAQTLISRQDSIWAAKAMLYVHTNQLEKAQVVLTTCVQAGFILEESEDLSAVAAQLH